MPLSGKIPFLLLVSIALLTSGCGGGSGSSGGGGSNPPPPPSTANEWTWMSGSETGSASGVYGTMGTPSSNNSPGARGYSAGWTDSAGNLWLFGGWGYGDGAAGQLNDLWKFNPSAKTWTWVGGSDTASNYGGNVIVGVYGTKGVPSVSNIPGPRSSAIYWTDKSGNFWLFGGEGYPSPTTSGYFNDLWEFNPSTSQWTWISGSNTINSTGAYGTQGVPSANNIPGARGTAGIAAARWIDSNGNLWLFGGQGFASAAGMQGLLNDLWEFSPTTQTWTWVSGSNIINAVGDYGTMGTSASANSPGARNGSVSWVDANGNFWLYGGGGLSTTTNTTGDLSDLWEFSPTTKQWTWVSGNNTGGILPDYGTLGTASTSNTPGGRDSAVGWTDSSGNLWLFGGFDYDTTTGANGTNDFLNDLWKFDTTTKEWTWMGGSNTGNANGVYGTLGTPAAGNVPGARGSEGVALTWTDNSGNLWLFGGDGYGATGASDSLLNDLWRYQP